ncbi:hypothetical protein ACSQ67_022613 [Phaseolus vulgaris]
MMKILVREESEGGETDGEEDSHEEANDKFEEIQEINESSPILPQQTRQRRKPVWMRDYETVKMHGLVRRMAWNILKESGDNPMVKCNTDMEKIPHIREWTIDLEAVSLANNRIIEIPEGTSPNCPRLSTLLLFDNLIEHIPSVFSHT